MNTYQMAETLYSVAQLQGFTFQSHCEASLHRLGLLYILLSIKCSILLFPPSRNRQGKKHCLITDQHTVFYFCLVITKYPVDSASTKI